MFISRIASRRIDGWSIRALGEEDAYAFCRANELHIVEDERQKFGQLRQYKGYMFILINPALSGADRLWVLFHEIGHFLLHDLVLANFSKSLLRKSDAEANYIAARAMIPVWMIETLRPDQIELEYGYSKDLIKIRMGIYKREGK